MGFCEYSNSPLGPVKEKFWTSSRILSFSRSILYALDPGVYSASNRNEYQEHKNNNVSGE
jgi:hypothetical protein